LDLIAGAFSGRRMALWHMAAGNAVDDTRGERGAFSRYEEMVDGTISQCSLSPSSGLLDDDRFYRGTISSDAVWVRSGACVLLSEFLSRNSIGLATALAFLCPDSSQPVLWAKIVQGLGWQKLALRVARASGKHSIPELETQALSHLFFVTDITVAAGAIACMKCEDSDTTPAFVFWGERNELKAASERLANSSTDIGQDGLKLWLSRGAQFSL
jgi:hypothetical protein